MKVPSKYTKAMLEHRAAENPGTARSGQVVATDKLLTELRRLGCRFRQRGSHITFAHDATHTRGTIVYGTRKLWSQKTVAAAVAKIRGLNDFHAPVMGSETLRNETPQSDIKATFAAAAFMPSTPLPHYISTETHTDYPAQIILRDKDYPQIGAIITVYDTPDLVKQTIRALALKKKDFAGTLSFLTQDGDFQVENKDGVLLIAHPVHDIQVLLEPYDPAEEQDPCAILSRCFEDLTEYADNQSILSAVIASRKLSLDTEFPQSGGVVRRTYVSRKFQREFGVRVPVLATINGYVSDEQLVSFMDEVDANFFNEIKHLLKKNYGFEVDNQRHADRIEVTHPLLKDLNFGFPNFARLPKLRDVYNIRAEIGEDEYYKRINDILEQRDNILELVSYGLIFSVEQMTESSNTLYDMLDKLSSVSNALKTKQTEKTEESNDENTEETERRHAAAKRSAKKFKKLSGKLNGASKVEYDRDAMREQSNMSQIRNQKLPEATPYGRMLTMPVKNPMDGTHVGQFQYMLLKGPDDENLLIFSADGLKTFQGFLTNAQEKLGVAPGTVDPAIAALQSEQAATFGQMTPAVPRVA